MPAHADFIGRKCYTPFEGGCWQDGQFIGGVCPECGTPSESSLAPARVR